jgi:FAD synthetase
MACKSKHEGNRKVVLASGVFDLLHLGHVKFLEEAKKAGGRNAELVVIVARDSTVEKRKGKRPIMPENQRCALVDALKIVDYAILGFEGFDIGKVIDRIKPNVVAVGYDQDGMERTVKGHVARKRLNVKVVKVGKFGENELASSSEIKRRIIEDYRR